MSDVRIFPGKGALISGASEYVTEHIRATLARSSQAFIALSGGSTPKPLYEQLAKVSELDWTRIHICFVDERNVAPDHNDSNYRMVREALLSNITIPDANVHRMRGELPADQAASEYEQELRALSIPLSEGWPSFDLLLLGIGPDGHTASLFPDTAALHESSRWVASNYVAKLNTHRITLTFPVINRARSIAFLVAGDDKAQPLADILSGSSTLPAAKVAPLSGDLVWFVDQAAAALIRAS